jgi:hypothetical protein
VARASAYITDEQLCSGISGWNRTTIRGRASGGGHLNNCFDVIVGQLVGRIWGGCSRWRGRAAGLNG